MAVFLANFFTVGIRWVFASVLLFVALLSGWEALAEPLRVMQFVKQDKSLDCPDCKEFHKPLLDALLSIPTDPKKKTIGHLALVDLKDKRLQVIVGKRRTDGACKDMVAMANGKTDEPIALPVDLRTVADWAKESGVDVAFNANFFKFQQDGGVRVKDPCGEVFGAVMHDGLLEWPAADAAELLAEGIDFSPKYPAWTLLFKKDGTADVIMATKLEDLRDGVHAIAGSLLYDGKVDNARVGTKADRRTARLAVGIMKNQSTLLVLLLEGRRTKAGGIQPGWRLNQIKKIMRELGAEKAINLDGSGSAQMVLKDGRASTPSDPEGARPVANHFGFRVVDKRPPLVSFGERMGEKTTENLDSTKH